MERHRLGPNGPYFGPEELVGALHDRAPEKLPPPRLVNDGFFGGLWSYFAPAGWATQWYWTPGTRGKVWNLLHGKGWRIG